MGLKIMLIILALQQILLLWATFYTCYGMMYNTAWHFTFQNMCKQ